MRYFYTAFLFFTLLASPSKAQTCDIQIEILPGRYMFAEATKISTDKELNDLQITFSDEFMEVLMPDAGEHYQIRVINHNCQAYCTQEKRVRQLNSGDESIVRNLFTEKKNDILAQIHQCQNNN